ncbi:MAG TPA: hypothetical protein VK465_17900 [Fibrobacteria bacterium]|nr:hypothetical protein [Fibrobacteria bacterium]
MYENQLRDMLGKGLPQIAATCFKAVYGIGFQAVEEAARDFFVETQAVGSQLVYSRSYQVYSFLIIEASHIFKLGLRAFPKYERLEIPKIVVGANGEALNTIMGKVSYLMGKVDEDAEVITTPPIVLNCSGPNRIPVRGAESIYLRLGSGEVSMVIVACVHRIQ